LTRVRYDGQICSSYPEWAD